MKYSYGIIPYKIIDDEYYFFVGHPGGCTYNKWAFMKGGVEEGEEPIDTALREFHEESGVDLSDYKDKLKFIGTVKQRRDKTVGAYAIQYDDIDPDKCYSNLCEKGWPEIDKYAWYPWHILKDITNIRHIELYDKIINNK